MIRVKICGITSLEDALWAVRSGADALGFVFSESPRMIAPEEARAIVMKLPPFITTVGLFVNEGAGKINNLVSECHLDRVQLHGEESEEFCHNFNRPVIKAFRIKDKSSLGFVNNYQVSAYLFDAYVPGIAGGTGATFSWNIVKERHFNAPVVLAGGLNPDNVRKAIRIVKPYAVDVSSGVELSPGVKDPGKIERFIKKVKSYRE